MNTLDYIGQIVIPGAFLMMPQKMNSKPALAMLLATGMQESDFTYRKQVGGPARGFWGFEADGGVSGVLLHPATRDIIKPILQTLRYSAKDCYAAIADNDILACVFARLLLYTLPKPLPAGDDPDGAWFQYLAAWRPGKPRRQDWDANYDLAWGIAGGDAP